MSKPWLTDCFLARLVNSQDGHTYICEPCAMLLGLHSIILYVIMSREELLAHLVHSKSPKQSCIMHAACTSFCVHHTLFEEH